MPYKTLPSGTWITLNDIARGTTEEQLLAFLRESGIELDETCVQVNQHRDRCQAIITLRHNDVAELLQRAILDRHLNGSVPTLVYRERKNL